MSLPLAGRRLLVTRRAAQAGELVEALRGLGAEVVEVPTIEITAPEDPEALRAAVEGLERYDWLALTSANAALAFAAAIQASGARLPASMRVASVGPATSLAWREALPDARVDVEPAARHRAAGLLAAMTRQPVAGRRVLIPASDRARTELADGLRDRGAHVEVVEAYRTIVPTGARQALAAAMGAGLAAVVLASPSAVEGLLALGGVKVRDVPAVVIGPTTAEAARVSGLYVLAVADPSTVDGLCAAAVRAFAR